jgi:3-oxoacyl-[acyl-carrier protein] reductase
VSSKIGKLRGRTAIVTGAGGGIGRGIALALAAEGASVVVAARRLATGEETLQEISREQGAALAVRCDVTVRDDVEAAVSAGVAAFGGLDIAIHNAVSRQSAYPCSLEEITDTRWHTEASVAWDGAYFLARSAFTHLKCSGHGRFVMMGSCLGRHGAAMNPVYTALKGGVRGFVKSLAREWAPYAITVNAVEPAAATEPTEIFLREHPELRADFLRNFPMGRLGDPQRDIGRAIATICSDDFGFVTAQNIQVDGGTFTAA